MRAQARFPFQPQEAVERAQARRVRRMVAHAYATVPYYRATMDRLGLRPDDFRGAADLAKLPIVGREELQRDSEAFVSTAAPVDRYLKLRSGGSTGAPRTVFYDAAALLENAAHGERMRSIYTPLIGRATRYRETVLTPPHGAASDVSRFVRARGVAPGRFWIERRFVSLLDPPERIAEQIDEFRPEVLRAYGSILETLFAHYRARGTPFHRPKLITYSSDDISPATRRLITEEYGIPVFAAYQAIEALKIGFECDRHRGYHLNLDLYPVRIVGAAGEPVPDGTSGEVVVSNLVGRATVLLNYRLGDLATVDPEPCPCGRSLPLLSALDGRRDDVIELPSGRIVHPQALRGVLTGEERVWQYQIVQQTPAHFTVAIMADPADRSALRDRVAAGLAARLVDPVTIEVTFVDAIARTAGGKVRPIVSRCQNGAGDAGVGGSDHG